MSAEIPIDIAALQSMDLRDCSKTPLRQEEDKEVYQVFGLDSKSGEITVYEVTERPELGGYETKKGERLYGSAQYCPEATSQHKKAFQESGEYPQLYFFDREETAIALGFRPCERCWATGEQAVERYKRYKQVCDDIGIEPRPPGKKLAKRIEEAESPLGKLRSLLETQIEIISRGDAQNKTTFDERIGDTKKLAVQFAPSQEEKIVLLLAQVEKIAETADGLTSLQDQKTRERLIRSHLKTQTEHLTDTTKTLIRQLAFVPKGFRTLLNTIETDGEKPLHRKTQVKLIELFGRISERVMAYDGDAIGRASNLFDIAISVYPQLANGVRKDLSKLMQDTAIGLKKKDRGQAAALLIGWMEETHNIRRADILQADEEIPVSEIMHGASYIENLLKVLEPSDFDEFGQFLLKAYDEEQKRQTLEYLLEHYASLCHENIHSFPIQTLEAMSLAFEEAGLLGWTDNRKIRLSPKATEESLTHHYLLQVYRAQIRLRERDEMMQELVDKRVRTFDDAIRLYEQYSKNKKPIELSILAQGESQRRLIIAGIGLGHQDTAAKFIDDLVMTIRQLPESQKPQVIVVNNLLAGAFENRGKSMQTALVPGLDTLETQFVTGRDLLNKMQALGIPVVLNLGNPDWEIARDIVLRILRYQFQLVGHIAYYEQDELQRMKEWSLYDRFVVDVALPYCFRKGVLLPAWDLLVLFDVHKELRQAAKEERPPNISEEYRRIIDLNAVPVEGKIGYGDNLYITDNVALTLGNDTNKHRAVLFDDYNFSSAAQPPLYQDPLHSIGKRVKQLQAQGRIPRGDTHVVLNQRLAYAYTTDGFTWIESAPAAQTDDFYFTRGSRRRAPDASRRYDTTRRVSSPESTFSVETTADGKRIYRLFDGPLMDLRHQGDRTTVFLDGDDQASSDTNLAHFYAIAHDIEVDALMQGPVFHVDGGDHGQWKNYKGREHIETGMPILNADDQSRFYRYVKFLALARAGKQEAGHMLGVIILEGNHETDTVFRLAGTNLLEPQLLDWKTWFVERGVEISPERVKLVEKIVTGQGDVYRSSTGIETIGDTGVRWLFQHKPLDKGAKGGGEEPLFLGHVAMEAFGSDAENIHGWSGFHFHRPGILHAMGKVFTIAPSKAGRSKYEHDRAYESIPGIQIMRFGGGLPPEFEFWGRKAMNAYKIKEGIFSEERLNGMGFFTDEGFDPNIHGFIPVCEPYDLGSLKKGHVPKYRPRSALMHYIWHIAETLPHQVHAQLG